MASAPGTRDRRGFFVVVPLLASLLAVAAFELTLRIFHPVPFASSESLSFEPDPHTGYRMRPGSVGYFRRPVGGPPIEARINSRGLRDAETPLEKPPHAFRILVLGDSMTLGVGVRQEEAWPEVMERLLRQRFGSALEVIAAGVAGWNPFQYAQYYEYDGRRFDPDLVLVGFFVGNDAFTRMRSIEELPTAAYGRRVVFGARPEGVSPLTRAGILLYAHSHYARLLVNRWRRAILDEELVETADQPRDSERLPAGYVALQARKLSSLQRDDPRRRERASNSVAQMLRIQRLAQADGALLWVVLLPDENQVNRALFEYLVAGRDPARFDRSMPQSMLLDMLRREGIEAIDLLPAIRASQRRLYLNDSHWRAEGHRLAGEALAAAIGPRVERALSSWPGDDASGP